MRPTKAESDLEFWTNARTYWMGMAEKYFLLDDREGEARCEVRLFAAELAHGEATGDIIVYSGRKKPEWAQ
jgi:ASC-1-like (ASCH) protein